MNPLSFFKNLFSRHRDVVLGDDDEEQDKNIPEAVREAAVGTGGKIFLMGEYEGSVVYQIDFGPKADTGMPALIFYKEGKAELVINDSNLSVLKELTQNEDSDL